jgi:thymidylate synthase
MLFIEDIRDEFARLRLNNTPVNGTLELIGESFIATEDSIFGEPNPDYIQRELDWYISGSLKVDDIPGGAPRIWKQIASNQGLINSNYGYLFFSEENGFQLDHVVKHLLADQNTRRATAVYTRPEIHQDWNHDGMSDFICTNAVQYLIRDGLLHVVVQMRSNDIVFGYRNDYAWHRFAQKVVIDELLLEGVEVTAGPILWNAASLHIYERHFWLLDHFIQTGDPVPPLTLGNAA